MKNLLELLEEVRERDNEANVDETVLKNETYINEIRPRLVEDDGAVMWEKVYEQRMKIMNYLEVMLKFGVPEEQLRKEVQLLYAMNGIVYLQLFAMENYIDDGYNFEDCGFIMKKDFKK